jgi:hypothetical protein
MSCTNRWSDKRGARRQSSFGTSRPLDGIVTEEDKDRKQIQAQPARPRKAGTNESFYDQFSWFIDSIPNLSHCACTLSTLIG